MKAWLDAVQNLSTSNFRREAYRKAYNVEEKIRAYKRAGKWQDWLNEKCITPSYADRR